MSILHSTEANDSAEGALEILEFGWQYLMNENISWVPIYIDIYKNAECNWWQTQPFHNSWVHPLDWFIVDIAVEVF